MAPIKFHYLPLVLLAAVLGAEANYRHFHMDNADVCAPDKTAKKVNVGTGAVIFQLQQPSLSFQPNYHNKAKQCQIILKVPEGFGLMAVVETMHLRRSTKDQQCVDYVQFGLDDIVPFVTLVKSERICGEHVSKGQTDVGKMYDDPYGNLIIWVSLGGRRETTAWPQISVVNLTIVVTAYQKECSKPKQGFRRCASGDRCIWKNYFCDHHINCPFDEIPADEDSCRYESDSDSDSGNSSSGSGAGSDEDPGLNAVSWTLIIVCSMLVLLLGLILLLRLRRRGRGSRCCCGGPSSADEAICELPESQQPRSIHELSRQRLRRGETEQNVYLPLNSVVVSLPPSSVAQSVETQLGGRPPPGRPPPAEESPPAYHELFPDRESESEEGSLTPRPDLLPEEPPQARVVAEPLAQVHNEQHDRV